MTPDQREAIMCVLDAITEGLDELRALLLDDGKPAPTLQPGMRALTPDGDVFYITAVTVAGGELPAVRVVGENWREGLLPVVLPEFMVPEQEAPSAPCVVSEDGLYRVLTSDGWGFAYHTASRGWGAVGWKKDFAMTYREVTNTSYPIIRAFPLQDA